MSTLFHWFKPTKLTNFDSYVFSLGPESNLDLGLLRPSGTSSEEVELAYHSVGGDHAKGVIGAGVRIILNDQLLENAGFLLATAERGGSRYASVTPPGFHNSSVRPTDHVDDLLPAADPSEGPHDIYKWEGYSKTTQQSTIEFASFTPTRVSPTTAASEPIFFGSNAYVLIIVSQPFVGNNNSWGAASAAAAASMFNGVHGHLATATSAAENQFLLSLVTTRPEGFNGAWLGGNFQGWLEGPEAGHTFADAGGYTTWNDLEPNDEGPMYMSIGTTTVNSGSAGAGNWLDDSGDWGIPERFIDPVIGYFIEYENAAGPTVSISDATPVFEGHNPTGGEIKFTITRTGGTAAFDIVFATRDGTAINGEDYGAKSDTLHFGQNENVKEISISIVGDTTFEFGPNEVFYIDLSGGTNATIVDGEGIGTIIDDDPEPVGSVAISDAAVFEGDSRTGGAIKFTITRTGGTAAFDIVYATRDGTAINGADYRTKSETVHFSQNENAKEISISIVGDTTFEQEPPEFFYVDLSGAATVTIADSEGIGTIVDDDPQPQVGSISINNMEILEGDSGSTRELVFKVTRTGGTAAFDINYETRDFEARASEGDYAAQSGRLHFADGDIDQEIRITIIGDDDAEFDDAFFVHLSDATGNGFIQNAQGTGTILNDDITGFILIDDPSVVEGDGGEQLINFTVSRVGGTAPFFVHYETAYWSATPSVDYVSDSNVLYFGRGVSEQTIPIRIKGDGDAEPDEKFYVYLSAATNWGTISDGEGVGTIVNNDGAPPPPPPPPPVRIAADDFDGDNKAELAVEQDGNVILYRDQNGIFAPTQVPNAHMGSEWTALDTGDLDGNGRADIVWIRDTMEASVWLMDGFSVARLGDRVGQMGPDWHAATVGDFNGDGKDDICWERDNGQANIWLMDGTAIAFAGVATFGQMDAMMGAEWSIAADADVNGDGRQDLLWVSESTGSLSTWLMNGANLVNAFSIGQIGAEWRVAGVGDFNQDNTTDVAWLNTRNNQVQIWTMQGGKIAQFLDIQGHVGLEWQLTDVADFTGEGRPDLLWLSAGGAQIWQIAGTQVSAVTSIAVPSGFVPPELVPVSADASPVMTFEDVAAPDAVSLQANPTLVDQQGTAAIPSLATPWLTQPETASLAF